MLKLIEENIPAELQPFPQWVCWKAVPKDNGKIDKIPFDPKTGRAASSTDPATWGTFGQAVAASKNGGGYAGIGFVLNGGPYVGVDLDDCRNPETGDIQAWAWEIAQKLNTYTEISPSGKGLRMFLKGELKNPGRRKGKIECYVTGRFLTVTGHHVKGTPTQIMERQDELDAFQREYIAKPKQKRKPSSGVNINMDDAELLERARKAKNGDLFNRLYNGDWTGYPSQSEADQAFCNMLAFWTGRNADQMERIFRQSGLYREKCDKHPTYLTDTIQKAIDDCQSVFGERPSAEQQDFKEAPGEEISWQEQLSRDKNGKLYTTINNALFILQNDELFKGKVALNEFSNQLDIRGTLPWGKDKGVWADSDDAELRYYFERNYNFTGRSKIDDAFAIATSRVKFHPVREYFSGLQWDGNPRLDTLLIDYLGAEDNEYTRTVTRKTFTAAVARVMDPGCKFDTMLVLVGSQGIGKSTFFRLLAGDEWFTDDLRMEDMKTKAGPEKMLGKWIIEVAELAGLRKTEVEEVKSFLSRNFDRYREPYGRRPKDQPRQCILVGTTNAIDGFLRDQTGNRRFWPVRVSRGKLKPWELDKIRDQIWAEAKRYYEAGEKLYLTHEMEHLATSIQEEYTEVSPWFGVVEKYLNEKPIGVTCGIEIWVQALFGDKNKYGRREQVEITNIMRKMPGWEPGGYERLPQYGKQRVFRRVC